MNKKQKKIIKIYIPLTLLLLILDIIFPKQNLVSYLKYATMITLFLIALRTHKKYLVQKYMNIALFFVVVADFFLVFCNTIPNLKYKVIPLGVISFMIAYIFLIIAFNRKFKIDLNNILALLPILCIYIPIYMILYPYVQGILYVIINIFGIILCYMTWTMVSTIFRGYYNRKISVYIAFSGFLIFISDILVANSLFNPLFVGKYVVWLKTMIWLSYVPAWILIVLIIVDNNLLIEQY